MANEWIPNYVFNTLESENTKVTLSRSSVCVRDISEHPDGNWIEFVPTTRQESHDLALMFRKAARRFEEIGKGLPNG